MTAPFLLYGSTGFVGTAIARLARHRGLQPILAGRDAVKVKAQAAELGLEHRVFGLDDAMALDKALREVGAVLHCAGPYLHTYRAMVDACLRTRTHYLDITGEIPVYAALAARDTAAKAQHVMILPGVGFDVAPTDCLAAYLKGRLPSAQRLTLAFHIQGPARMPPGTMNTLIEIVPHSDKVRRRNGRLEHGPVGGKTRLIDFGQGVVQTTMLGWGDVFMAYYSTAIPNIEAYMAMPARMRHMLQALGMLRPLFRLAAVRNWTKRAMAGMAGSTAAERAQTRTHVWGEVEDDQGRRAMARLHGPEAGVVWTAQAALAAMQHVVAGDIRPGFQTAALAYGADFVLECEGVTREDVLV